MMSNNKNKTYVTKKFNCLRKNKSNNPEKFIMNLHKKQVLSGLSNNNKLLTNDQRRVVFVSLLGLYQTWKQIPSAILYSSIFILPLENKWIYSPTKYKNEIKQTIIGQMNIFDDETEFNEFLCLLKWKNSQKLLFCMLENEYNKSDANSVIAPFWQHFNQKLTELYDPITKSKYKPINFTNKFWTHNYNTKYNVETEKILAELYFATMKYKTIKEILYQSNPHSLNIITSYVSDPSISSDILFKYPKKSSQLKPGFVETSMLKEDKLVDSHGFVAFKNGLMDSTSVNKNEGVWMISADYNEYDIENDEIEY